MKSVVKNSRAADLGRPIGSPSRLPKKFSTSRNLSDKFGFMHPPVKLGLRGLFGAAIALVLCSQLTALAKDVVYLTPGLDLPFWRYLSKGVESVAQKEGYGYQAFDSKNDAQTQLKNAQDAIARGVAGIVISPTDSSTCPSVLALTQKANIPVVIADIGTNEGEYVSFIISDNREGAYGTGKALVAAMKEKGMTDGTVGQAELRPTAPGELVQAKRRT